MAARRGKKDLAPVGACFGVPLSDGRFAACQVIGATGKQREIMALDWLGERMPTLEDLAGARVLIVDHHNWAGQAQRCNVDANPPASFRLLGVREPLAAFEDPCNSFGGWQGVAIQVPGQWWWDHRAPKAETEAFKQAIEHARELVRFELGGVTYERVRGLVGVQVGPDTDFPIAADGKVDWSVFDGFGRLTSIAYEGHDAGVLGYVTRRALINEFAWKGHGQTRIDLSGARLDRVSIEVGDGPLVIALSAEIRSLQLDGYRNQALTIEHPEAGRGLSLTISGPLDGTPRPIAGLERLTDLSLIMPGPLELGALGYPGLEQLRIHANRAAINQLDALRRLPNLHTLRLFDAYTIDPEQVPLAAELPALTTVEIHGLRKTHAVILKQRLAGLARLELSGAKTEAWLAANFDNPFSDWVDEGAALGRAACKAYKTTVARVAKLALEDLEGLHAELLAFVQAFNRIDENQGLDTIHREHIYEVFHQLVEDRGFAVPSETLDEWFDEDRDF